MCKYCEASFVGDVPVVNFLGGNKAVELDGLIDGDMMYVFCTCGTKLISKINYCPMCGRKLEGR